MENGNDSRPTFAQKFLARQNKNLKNEQICFAFIICLLIIVSFVFGARHQFIVALITTSMIPVVSIVLIVVFSRFNERVWNNFYDQLDSMAKEK